MNSTNKNRLDVIAVEDSNDDTFLLKRQLEGGGFLVSLERVDTEAALTEALRRQHWDIVFSDFSMPQFNAVRALEVVRAHDADIPFIIVSGTIGEERAVEMMRMGAQDYVIKGNIRRLIPAVERELAEARVRREHRLAQHQIEQLAYYNQLTQLPNRHRLIGELQQQLVRSNKLAVMIVRLNNFREINEILGYHNGDRLIREVAARLQGFASTTSALYHLEGNEFALLCTTNDRAALQATVHNIIDILDPPHDVSGLRVHVGTRIGIVLSGNDAASFDPAFLLQCANSAVAVAKRQDSTFCWYEPSLDATRSSQLALVADLHDAFHSDQLFMVFQPKIDCRSGAVTGSEALLRWHHPKKGMIPPDAFIGMAERYGLIDQLTHNVFARVVNYIRSAARPNVPVAINLSVKNLLDAKLMAEILKDNPENGGSHRIEIEITETALMRDPDRALDALHTLHDAGVKIYIDDFGTGFSSLGYLGKMPVDAVKIDKSFVLDLARKTEADTIVRSTIALAHNLGLKVIAEGVQDKETWEQLRAYGCDEGQGYYFAKPMPASEFDAWMAEKREGWTPT